ncbi:hypothetical protein A6R68_05918 [Neotoma lepida]|uniref:Nucleoplasmin core domain-containing protein n=1 Tax=Neotoma lepida TaxID=56216 RepID=A0A1A6GIF5_NEOLE|nr:hypothetical protein A6R68_05918 [Neotoma lepida]
MEDLMDMDMSPLRPQNYLFGCEPEADKDYHFKVDNDDNEHQLSLRTVLQKKVKLDEDEEDDDEDDEDDEDDDDDDFDYEEAEEKVPVKKFVQDTPAKNAQKSNQNGEDLKPSTPRSKGQESFKKQEKNS